jgi:hypothetical protein
MNGFSMILGAILVIDGNGTPTHRLLCHLLEIRAPYIVVKVFITMLTNLGMNIGKVP